MADLPLRAAAGEAARAALALAAGACRSAAAWLGSKLATWAVETREATRKPAPLEPPCQATLNTGGFRLLCAWARHGGPEHMDPAYGVWTAGAGQSSREQP